MLRLLLCLLTSSLAAQNFVSFPDSNAQWISNEYSGTGRWLNYSEMLLLKNQDTLIANQVYRKLFSRDWLSRTDSYHAAYRQDSSRLWIIPEGEPLPLLVYDFNLQPGDTLDGIYTLGGFFVPGQITKSMLITVISKGTIQTGLGLHRTIRLSDGAYWIEGIGSVDGFLWDWFSNVSNYSYALECFSRGDSSYYRASQVAQNVIQSSPLRCEVFLREDEEPLADGLQVYPNPSRGKLNLVPREPQEVKLLNAQGQIIWQASINSKTELDLGHLEAGFYFIWTAAEVYSWVRF